MSKQFKQKKIKKKIYSWWTVGILGLIAFVFITNTWDVYKKYSVSRQNVAGLNESYQQNKDREEDLRQKIESLNTEKGLEEEIRQKFNVAKEGEGVVVIVDDEVPEETQEQEEVGFLKGLWQDVLEVFK